MLAISNDPPESIPKSSILALIDCDEAGRPTAVVEVDMVARGRVRNGVVVLENGVRLSEGQEVMVLAPAALPQGARPHGILDISPVSMGAVLRPFTADDDLLGDMLEGRSRSMGSTLGFS